MTHTSLHAPRPTWRARVQTAFAMMLVGVLAVGATGCGSKDSSTGPTNVNPAGEYDLETIQTKPLPATVYDGPAGDPGDDDYLESYVVTVTGGGMTLEDNGYYHILIAYTGVMDGEPYSLFFLETGTYETNGSRIVLTNDYGEEAEGTVRDGEVSIRMGIAGTATMPYVFGK
jgi:hypothetical protein